MPLLQKDLPPEFRSPARRGLGAMTATVLKRTGIGKIGKKCVERLTGKPCGCGKREKSLDKAGDRLAQTAKDILSLD